MAPSNVLLAGPRVVFIDLEYCGRRHAFYDAMFWRCICPFPATVADAMETAYRAGLAEGGRAVADNSRFEQEMTALAAHRLFWSLTWGAESLFDADRPMAGSVGGRELYCAWISGFVRLASRADFGPALASSARALGEALAARWEIAAAAPVFPAFGGHATQDGA